MKTFTIRTKLTVLYFVVLVLSLSVFIWISDAGFRSSIEVSVSDASTLNLQSLQRMIKINAPRGTPKLQKELAELASWWPSGAVFEVADAEGNWLYRSPLFLQANVEIPRANSAAPSFLTTNLNHVQYRIGFQQFSNDGVLFHLYAAVPTEPFDRALDNFRALEKRTVPLLVILASILGYWLSGRSLAPVTQIIESAERIGVENLSRRLKVPRANDELRRLTEALNAMLGRIEASFHRIAGFTADASHDLRTPMAVIRTTAEVTLNRPRSAEQYRDALQKIVRTSEETTHLLDNLLTLARADAGTAGLELHLLDIAPHVRKAYERASALAAGKSLKVSITVMNEPCWIRGDAIAIDRLLLILVDNAIKYTGAGGSCRMELSSTSEFVDVVVRDSGIGIANHELEQIFERSFRSSRARSRDGGAGLGLAIGQWIAQMHGGKITVESEVDAGSSFQIRFPAQHPAAEELASLQSTRGSVETAA